MGSNNSGWEPVPVQNGWKQVPVASAQATAAPGNGPAPVANPGDVGGSGTSLADFLTGANRGPANTGVAHRIADDMIGLGSSTMPIGGENMGQVSEAAGAKIPDFIKSPINKLADLTGASKLPDYFMQKAVGMKKYMKGVGDTLVDNGIWGGADAMRGQIAKKYPETEAALQSEVGKLQGSVDHAPIAQAVGDEGKKLMTSSGVVPEALQPGVDMASARAADIAKRAPSSPQEALEFARLASKGGYKEGRALTSQEGKLAQTERDGYRGALSDMWGKQNQGAPTNTVDSLMNKERAFINAKRGLNAPQTLYKGPGMTTILGGIGGAADAGAHGKDPLVGLGKGMAIGAAARNPLVLSSLAKALRQGPGALKGLALSPAVLKGLLSKDVSEEEK